MQASGRSRRNLIVLLIVVFVLMLLVAVRVGWVQIVKGDEYSELALQQQTKDTPIEAERGIIYDRNGEILARSVNCYTIYAAPPEIGKNLKKAKKNAEFKRTADGLAKVLDKDPDKLLQSLKSGATQVKVAREVDKDTADKIRNLKLTGITISSDTKRSYPNGTMASCVLGTVSDDGVGQSGIELKYNKYLKGTAGRWVNYTDSNGKQLSYSPSNEKYYQAIDGYGVVTTIDEVIQSYTESALETVMKKTSCERAFAIVMDTETGEILAMAQNPNFDPNDPYVPASPAEKAKFEALDATGQSEYLSRMWRNFLINDTYEPGSVFKLLTTSIALEEDVTSMSSTYNCVGYLTVAGQVIHCWHTAGHGTQTLKQAVGNSCNPVFMTLATQIGIEKFYDYLDNFGITGTTGIDFASEGRAILQDEKEAGPVGLATIGFGQGVAVTPIQLITAVSSLGNDGNLMKPRLVKEIKDADGNTVEEMDSEIVRQTVSEETAEEMREIMEFVVSDGGGGAAAVDGYRVGAKTGTANKAVNGGYSDNTYSSCLGMAPMSDPKLTVLVIVDSPKGVKYGSVTAAPAVGTILNKSLKYMNITPDSKERASAEAKVKVPDVVGHTADEAIGMLAGQSLKFDMDKDAENEDFVVVKQYPSAGTKVKKGTKVYLYDE
ncbi:MAG: penicillin-binding transpeptidase domain-containing protein [Bacillota bacterium]|nr:penicillin-binding transpeptidase domain-containing protein [Bacillota bacterium]